MYFTYFNLALFASTFMVRDPTYVEFVRATSAMVFLGWFLVLITYGYSTIIRFYRGHFNNPRMSAESIIVLDIICHILPFAVLGIPRRADIFFVATCVILIWYILVRLQISKMYYLPPEHLHYRDAIVAGGAVATNLALYLI